MYMQHDEHKISKFPLNFREDTFQYMYTVQVIHTILANLGIMFLNL
mgnify:CR=1 FL=1